MPPNHTPFVYSKKYVRCDDLHEFWLEWSSFKDVNQRYPWAYVYIAHGVERDLVMRDGILIDRSPPRDRWKIGVSIHPWKRRSEVSARSIVFSRLVYQPYKLERGLHTKFAAKRRPSSEWFFLGAGEVRHTQQLIDYWQLMNPVQSDFSGIRHLFGQVQNPDPIWEYDSFRDDLKFLRGE